jgi:hypothetical protein
MILRYYRCVNRLCNECVDLAILDEELFFVSCPSIRLLTFTPSYSEYRRALLNKLSTLVVSAWHW